MILPVIIPPELIHEMPAAGQGPPGWLVIDTSVNGRSHGGLRISLETGAHELQMLARRMTLKFGFLGIANGGAKAGIRFDPEAAPAERATVLRRFAESIHRSGLGEYQPHADMGTTEFEIREAFGLKSMRGRTSREDSGGYTALGVAVAAGVALRMSGKQWSGLSVAVHGFGKVGSAFAQLAAQRGALVVGVSTSHGALHDPRGLPVDRMLQAASASGSRFVREFPDGDRLPSDALLHLPVDLLSPCAGSGSIHAGNVASVQAAVICPGANSPVTEDALSSLESRGVQYVPDFLANAGGVLGGTMAFAGLDADAISALMPEYLAPRFEALFRKSRQAVEQECLARFREVKETAERSSIRGSAFRIALDLYRHGWIPRVLVGKLAPRYFLSR